MSQSEHTIAGRPVHRRHHRKRDGRDLFLYSLAPHTLPVTEEADLDIARGGELRRHPLRGEWNLYAPHRQNRTFKPGTADDPLAPTRPGSAPTEIPFADFELAVFENRFTSLHEHAPEPSPAPGTPTARAHGRCEVVVYGPEPTGDLHSLGQARRRLLLAAWLDRYEALFAMGCRYVLPFENRGDEVGVTLRHPHGQIYGFPFVPRVQAAAAAAFDDGYDLAEEIKAWEAYTVADSGPVTAFCPPFARFPYECWIAPRRRVAGPWEFTEEEADGFCELLGDITRRYDALFGRPAATMLALHAAPGGASESWHFTARFMPLLRGPDRVKYLAGVEQSTGVFTVDVMPETAAESLRVL